MRRTDAPPGSATRFEYAANEASPLSRAWRAVELALAIGAVLVGAARFSNAIMLVAAGALFLTGVLHHRRVLARLGDREYMRDPRLRRLTRTDRRFAYRWIGAGALLLVIVWGVDAPLPVALFGGALALLTYVNGIAIGADVAEVEEELKIVEVPRPGRKLCVRRARRALLLPGTDRVVRLCGHRSPLGQIGLSLTWALLLVVCISAVYLGVAIGSVLSGSPFHGERKPKDESTGPQEVKLGTAGGGSEAEALEPASPTWAELCPELPDPLDIEHGLGELFRREGALKAGCGTRTRPVAGREGMYIATGICSGEVRSLAVVSSGYTPAMLYDEAAAFAEEAARAGELLFVDAAEPGSGEVAVIGTTSGNFIFARSSPSIRRPNENARRCSEVSALARPFVELVPSLAYLWLQHTQQFGWAWPVEQDSAPVGEITFVGYDTGIEVATGHCVEEACELNASVASASHEELEYEGIAFVELGMLAPYMPEPDQ